MFKNRCYNGGNCHKFSPRYDVETKPNVHVNFPKCDADDAIEIIKALSHRKETYRGDVCEWCGKVVNDGK